MASDAHKAYQETYRYHASVAAYDGGACLVKHVVPFVDNESCSYRWQGVNKAEQSPGKDAYNAHRNKNHHVGGRGTGPFDPSRETSVTNSPGMAGKVKASRMTKKGLKSIIEVKNFTSGRVPYGNQVHHLLNASSLRVGIDDLAETWYPIRWVIVNGLLAEKYNINHRDNCLVLPTTAYHSRETGLPTHYGSHPSYSKKIKAAVQAALAPYEKIASQKKKESHDKLEPEKVKKEFLRISETMYANIVGLAAANRVARKATRINEMSPAGFRGL